MGMKTAIIGAVLACAGIASADQVVFKNGDKLTGKVETLEGGKLKITSAVAGEITVSLTDVETFSTDQPVSIQTTDGRKTNEPVAATENNAVKPAEGDVIPLNSIAKLNPKPEKWTGSIVLNAAAARGNSNTEDLGVKGTAVLRRNNDFTNDRFTLGGEYNLGRQEAPDSGDKVTTVDNWTAAVKYDRYWTQKFYTYGLMKVDHDRIADLNYRLSPGVGIGYQWIESEKQNFNTEAGITYVYEDYINDGNDDHVALRLAYHYDRVLNSYLKFFSDGEYLPAFDDPGDYNTTLVGGLRAKMTKSMFAELKVEWKRDSTPAPDAEKNDLRYILGIGWTF